MTQEDRNGRRVRVVIADDQRPTRQGLKALLSLLPPSVEVIGEAGNGQAAVELVAERRPDVVIMDVRMPVVDGLEATRQIKSRWPEIRVIALTMYPTYRADAQAAGADVFLLKGCSVEDLRAAIVAHL